MTLQFLYRVFRFPVGLLALGCLPVLSWLLYGGHGGPAWFILPFCFPYILARLTFALWRLPAELRGKAVRTAATASLVYILISYPMTRWTEHYITSTIGLPILPGTMFKLATFPVGFVLPPYYTRAEWNNPDLPVHHN